ncbi:hypothetical protein [Planctomycetes bacterium K23_9]|uniref:SLA1 homology domain-containing protein n=1 Tax=Stieleria marina TaxID=1930275 RepID=A0A517NSD2_9BACT|nr:hypothetical protein K239x_19970 [Planctomycetes bacterium K23_9]
MKRRVALLSIACVALTTQIASGQLALSQIGRHLNREAGKRSAQPIAVRSLVLTQNDGHQAKKMVREMPRSEAESAPEISVPNTSHTRQVPDKSDAQNPGPVRPRFEIRSWRDHTGATIAVGKPLGVSSSYILITTQAGKLLRKPLKELHPLDRQYAESKRQSILRYRQLKKQSGR